MFLGGISGTLVGNRLTQPNTNDVKSFVVIIIMILIIIIIIIILF